MQFEKSLFPNNDFDFVEEGYGITNLSDKKESAQEKKHSKKYEILGLLTGFATGCFMPELMGYITRVPIPVLPEYRNSVLLGVRYAFGAILGCGGAKLGISIDESIRKGESVAGTFGGLGFLTGLGGIHYLVNQYSGNISLIPYLGLLLAGGLGVGALGYSIGKYIK